MVGVLLLVALAARVELAAVAPQAERGVPVPPEEAVVETGV